MAVVSDQTHQDIRANYNGIKNVYLGLGLEEKIFSPSISEIVAEKNFQIQTDGPYGAEGYIVQEFHALPDFDGFFPVLGCWVVAGQPAGLGIREGQNLITTEQAHFVPHVIFN